MSKLPPSKRARLTEVKEPPAAPSSLLKPSQPQSHARPTFADVAYILCQSKVLHFRQLAKTSLLLSKEVSACIFPNRSELWIGLCRDRFGTKMIEQLKEAKLLASADDGSETVEGDRFERLFRMLAVKGMCKERGWTPEIPEDAQCLADIDAPETREGEMPELKDLEYKLDDYCLVLQIFGNEGCDEAPLLSKVLSSGESLKRLLNNSEHFGSAEIDIEVDPISLASSDRVDIISEAHDRSYGFNGNDCSTLLGPVHATVHIIRRPRSSKLESLCIYSGSAAGNTEGCYNVCVDNYSEKDSRIDAYFSIPGAKISLEEGAKDCFDRLEMGEDDYLPDHAASITMELSCETSIEDADTKVVITTKEVTLRPNLHAFYPSCGHSKCRACLGEDEELSDFYSFNGVTFAHILENTKRWD